MPPVQDAVRGADDSSARRWVEIRPSTGVFRGLDLRELWRYREVFRTLVLRDFKAHYKQAVFGIAWAVVSPLAGVVLFTFVFDRLAGLPSEGLPYPVFVFSALLVWDFYSSGVTAASGSLVHEPDLVTKIYFPRILAPAAAIAPALIDLAIGFVVLLVVMAAYGVAPPLQILLSPAWLALLGLVTLGVGAWYAALHVRFYDIGHVAGLTLSLWLYITPVVYPLSEVHGAARIALAANPMTVVVDLGRWCLVGGHAPQAVDLISLASLAAFTLAGIAYFQRTERRFADLI